MSRNDEQIDRYLSGDLPLDELPQELRWEEQKLRDLLETIREEPEVSPRLYDAVMREVAATPDPVWKRAVDWLLRPRTIRLSPATGGLAFAALVAAVMLVPGGEPAVGPDAAASSDDDDVVTRFVFIAPEASSVRITGDFVDWNREGIALKEERATGVWTVDVPLEPGVYQYGFVVDGVEWRPDPRAVSTVDDGFGRENSVLIVSDENIT